MEPATRSGEDMSRIVLSIAIALSAIVGSSISGMAQDIIRQERPAKTQVKPSRKPAAEPVDKVAETSQPSETDQAMQRAITSLSTQIGLLNDEVRKLRRETERNSEMM